MVSRSPWKCPAYVIGSESQMPPRFSSSDIHIWRCSLYTKLFVFTRLQPTTCLHTAAVISEQNSAHPHKRHSNPSASNFLYQFPSLLNLSAAWFAACFILPRRPHTGTTITLSSFPSSTSELQERTDTSLAFYCNLRKLHIMTNGNKCSWLIGLLITAGNYREVE